MNKGLYVTWNGLLFTILFYFLLPMQSASAILLEYSISGHAYFNEQSQSVDVTGTAYIDDENINLSDPSIFDPVDPAIFNITYFDMYVGGQYNNFTGTSGYVGFSTSDSYGYLYGTGDWSMMEAHAECSLYMFNENLCTIPFEGLAYELPTTIFWNSNNDELVANNPLLVGLINRLVFTMERVGPVSVPEPSIIWLLGSGLALIGFARRKA